MRTTIDGAGRIVVPKVLRDRLGLVAGTELDISEYGAALQITPGGRTARLRRRNGSTVLESDTVVTDEDIFRLIDDIRR